MTCASPSESIKVPRTRLTREENLRLDLHSHVWQRVVAHHTADAENLHLPTCPRMQRCTALTFIEALGGNARLKWVCKQIYRLSQVSTSMHLFTHFCGHCLCVQHPTVLKAEPQAESSIVHSQRLCRQHPAAERLPHSALQAELSGKSKSFMPLTWPPQRLQDVNLRRELPASADGGNMASLYQLQQISVEETA